MVEEKSKVSATEYADEVIYEHFPMCPICKSRRGYQLPDLAYSVKFRNYIPFHFKCEYCKAKWEVVGEKEMVLVGASKDGKGCTLLRKKLPFSFWETLDIEKVETPEALRRWREEEVIPEYEWREKPSGAWFLLPILFGIVGGLIGYAFVRDEDEDMAKDILTVGIVTTIIITCIIIWVYSYLFPPM